MNKVHTQKDWREEFEKEFSNVGWHPKNKKHLLSFISSVEKKAVEGVIKKIEQMALHKMLTIEDNDEDTNEKGWYNQALAEMAAFASCLSPSTNSKEEI